MKEIIKQDIEARGLTKSEYADLLGVDKSTVTKWLNGSRKPSFQVLMLIGESSRRLRIKNNKAKVLIYTK